MSNFSNFSEPTPLLVRTSSDASTETWASASAGGMGHKCEALSFYRRNRIVIILVIVKNISANLPSIILMVGMNTCQGTVMGERERERE